LQAYETYAYVPNGTCFHSFHRFHLGS
jgi:hypothetical protein